jgi:hypothetical protein
VKVQSKESGNGKAAGLATREIRTCPTCATKFSATGDRELCPVCALRIALDKGHEAVELTIDPTASLPALRFDHYELLKHEDGRPFELGRGAMGVTYKAIDVNLRSVMALKVINSRFIGDESAQRRFVREARAAASVRHPNVASVFHLGKSGDSYFYAMELWRERLLSTSSAARDGLN